MELGSARTKNFTSSEIDLLLHLVEQQNDIIECKKTDKSNTELKDRAWRKLTAQFNATSIAKSERSSKVLKTKYFNLKACRRLAAGKDQATTQNKIQKTAVCDEPAFEISSEKETSNPSPIFNKDSIHVIYNSEDAVDEVVVPEVVNEPYESWTSRASTPRLNKTNNQRSTNRKISQSSWVKLAEIKAKWTEVKMKQEIESLKTEHELRTEFLKEKHELEKKLMLEKHEVEMKILRQKLEEKYSSSKETT